MRIHTDSARKIHLILNFWPPLLFCGTSITELSDDYSYMKASLKD
ncbi:MULTISPECIES: hypothetical protein [Neisseria]|nr:MULTISPECIES: hypothetical protein [Neisseria]